MTMVLSYNRADNHLTNEVLPVKLVSVVVLLSAVNVVVVTDSQAFWWAKSSQALNANKLAKHPKVKNLLPTIDYRRDTLYSEILQTIARDHRNHESIARGQRFISSISGSFAPLRSGWARGCLANDASYCAWSDLGSGLKYEINQDAFAITSLRKGTALVVFDGISTGGVGELATEIAVNTVRNEFPNSSLHQTIVAVQKNLNEQLQLDKSLPKNYGVVAVGAYIEDNLAIVSHSGDGRLLQIRDDEIVFHTFDHNPTYRAVIERSITPQQYVQDTTDKSLVDKSLRARHDPKIADGMVDLNFVHLKKNDRLVLASDALWNLFTNDEVIEMIAGKNEQEAVAFLRSKLAERVGDNKKRDDNVTIIVYRH